MVREFKSKNLFQNIQSFTKEVGYKMVAIYAGTVLLVIVIALTFLLSQQTINTRQNAQQPEMAKSKMLDHLPSSNFGSYAPGEILMRFKEGVDEEEQRGIMKRYGAAQIEELPHIKVKRLRVDEHALQAVIKALQNNPTVDFAEVNAIVVPELVSNDPYLSSEWHHAAINVPLAWDSAKATGVLIGVCDTGVEATHPDLQPILRADLGYNTVDNTTDWSPIAGHGTLVSGAAAAEVDNGIGVAGVAWGAQVIPVRITNSQDGNAFINDGAECITYSADKGAKAINLSYRMANYATIDFASSYAKSKGALTFVAAGNDNIEETWTNYPNFLAVSATEFGDKKASFSSWGDFVDISAPGVNIWTTRPGATYGASSGTSLASPVAAGVAALIFGAKPSLTADEAQQILLSTATDVGTNGFDKIYGYGRINAFAAISKALNPIPVDTTPPTVAITSPSNGDTIVGSISLSATASDNTAVAKVDFFANGVFIGADFNTPYQAYWSVNALDNGTHTITAKAYDVYNNSSESTVIVTLNSPPDTIPPTISISYPTEGATVLGIKEKFNSIYHDNIYLVSLDYKIDGTLVATKLINSTGGSGGILWDTTKYSNGPHVLSVTVYDRAGNNTTASVNVIAENVADTTAPTVSIGLPKDGTTISGYHSFYALPSDAYGISKVELYVDEKIVSTHTEIPYGINLNTIFYTNGAHILKAKAYDPSGNIGISTPITVTFANPTPTPTPAPLPTATPAPNSPDTISPTVTISSPLNGAKVTGNVSVNASASDNIGVVRMEVYIDNVLKTTSGGSTISTNWNVKGKSVSTGNHTILVRAFDGKGNVGSSTISVTK